MTNRITLKKPPHNSRVIDVTPTWTEVANMLAVVITDGTPKGREIVAAEVRRMGQLLDNLLGNQGGA